MQLRIYFNHPTQTCNGPSTAPLRKERFKNLKQHALKFLVTKVHTEYWGAYRMLIFLFLGPWARFRTQGQSITGLFPKFSAKLINTIASIFNTDLITSYCNQELI